MSLHRHINASYKFDNFTPSFVEILAAQQTPEGSKWYQGTADAVRQNMRYFLEKPVRLLHHPQRRSALPHGLPPDPASSTSRPAPISPVATIPVNRDRRHGFGLMDTDEDQTDHPFRREAEGSREARQPAHSRPICWKVLGHAPTRISIQASMGIYVFNRKVLKECLDNEFVDFGKNVIPAAIEKYKVQAYIFQGYWEDIGTIGAFFEANLNLTDPEPKYSFNVPGAPIYTHPAFPAGQRRPRGPHR